MGGLFLYCFLLPMNLMAEAPPPPEYPYPDIQQPRDLGVEKPIRKDSSGAYYYPRDTSNKKPKSYKGVEKPTRVNKDGSYFYGDAGDEKMEAYEGVEQPIDRDGEGSYYYNRKKEKKRKEAPYGPQPAKINADGSYMYDVPTKETSNTLYIRGGALGPPSIQPVAEGGSSYEHVYGGSSSLLFNLEYDWNLFGSLNLKVGTGVSNAEGQGQFAGGANPQISPKEKFQFYVFPTTVSLSYQFRFSSNQLFTPYVDAGPGYFGFMEMRSDGDNTKFGGAPVLTGAAGLLISLTRFQSGTNMLTEYGISHTWLDLQYKQVVGLDSRKDFSSNMITGGFAVGF